MNPFLSIFVLGTVFAVTSCSTMRDLTPRKWQFGVMETAKITKSYKTDHQIRQWTASIYIPEMGNFNGKVLWYFHGALDGPDITNAVSGDGIQAMWENFGTQKPIVVGISHGNFWFLNSWNSKRVESLMDQIRDEFQLHQYDDWGLGISMGGPNLMQICKNRQRDTDNFEKIVIVSPRPKLSEMLGVFNSSPIQGNDILVVQGEIDEFGQFKETLDRTENFYWRHNRNMAERNGYHFISHPEGHRLPRSFGGKLSKFFENGEVAK